MVFCSSDLFKHVGWGGRDFRKDHYKPVRSLVGAQVRIQSSDE